MTEILKVNVKRYVSYQDAHADLLSQGVKDLGWINDGKTKVPGYCTFERAYKNWSGSSCLYVDPTYRVMYSVDMGD